MSNVVKGVLSFIFSFHWYQCPMPCWSGDGRICSAHWKMQNPCSCHGRIARDSAGRIIASAGRDRSRSRRSIEHDLRSKIRRNTQQKNRDVLLLLDESGSVGEKNFEIEKRIAAALIQLFCGTISGKTRIAVASFDKKNHIHYHFTNRHGKNNVELAKAVRNIKYDHSTAGASCIKESLSFALDEMFKTSRGARINDDGTEQLIFMITDGCRGNCGSGSMSGVRKLMEKQKIALVTMFLGNSPTCVKSLHKNLSQGAKCYNFFARSSWTRDDTFSQRLEKINGMECVYNVWMGRLATLAVNIQSIKRK